MSTVLEYRVKDIEWIMKELAYAQLQTEIAVKEFSHHLDRAQEDNEKFRQDNEKYGQKIEKFIEEMREDRRELNRKWGELANRLGTIVEDIVAPNIPGIMRTYFGKDEPDTLMVRVRKKHPSKPDKRREFDVIAVTPDTLFLNETKSTPRMDYLESFAGNYREVFEYFPEYAHLAIVPIFSSLFLPQEGIEYLTSRGIYAMMMSDTSMDLVNFKEVSA